MSQGGLALDLQSSDERGAGMKHFCTEEPQPQPQHLGELALSATLHATSIFLCLTEGHCPINIPLFARSLAKAELLGGGGEGPL